MVDQTTDGFNEALREAHEVVAVLAKLRARIDPMSTENKFNDLIAIRQEAGVALDIAEKGMDVPAYSEALAAYKLAHKDVKEFKVINVDQILKDRRA